MSYKGITKETLLPSLTPPYSLLPPQEFIFLSLSFILLAFLFAKTSNCVCNLLPLNLHGREHAIWWTVPRVPH